MEYAKLVENRLLNSFRLPFAHGEEASPTSEATAKFFQRCPACHQLLSNTTKKDNEAKNDNELDDEDLFANRLSNRYVMAFPDEMTAPTGGESEVPMVELSPVALQLFYQNRASLYVPLHLFYCLALQEVGFRVLRDNDYLSVIHTQISC